MSPRLRKRGIKRTLIEQSRIYKISNRTYNLFVIAVFAFLLAGTLSAASVKDSGATGNGTTDDTNAIQAAIDTTPSGGTLTFPAGTYQVTRSLVFRSNRTYQGQAGAIIRTATQDFAATTEYDAAANLTIDTLTFDGGGLMIPGSSAAGNNVHITHCTFQNIVNGTGNWPAHNGIFIAAGLTGGSTIAYNRFTNITEPGAMEDVENDHTSSGIMMYNLAQTSITDNTFDGVYQGISAQFSGSSFPGIVIARNTFNQIHRMGIEMQGSGTQKMSIDSNRFSNFHNPWYGTCAASIVVDGGQQTQITNNYISASPAAYTNTSQGVHYGIGLEIGGSGTAVSGNTIENPWGYGSAVVGNSPYVSVQNNVICNAGNAGAIGFEAGTQPGAVTTPNSILGACPAGSPSDTTPPTVALTSPSAGAVVSGTLSIGANAGDNVGVASVAFVLDGSQQLGSVTVAPYAVQMATSTLANGSHTITAVAMDAAGNKATSAAVTVTVSNASTPTPPPPSGSIPTSGLTMWLRADQGVTLNGAKVSRWADQSGHGSDATQPMAASQPSFVASGSHGKPVLRFNGTSSFLGFNLPINGLTGMTIVLVGNNRANQQGGDVGANSSAIHWGETAWWGVTYLSPFQTTVPFRFGTTQTGNLPLYNRPASVGTSSTLNTAIKNGTTDTLYVNGQKVLASSGKLATIAASTNTGFIGQGDLSTFFSGDISEILVYNRALTDAERQTVEGIVAARNLQ
jgi:hypothetical protein